MPEKEKFSFTQSAFMFKRFSLPFDGCSGRGVERNCASELKNLNLSRHESVVQTAPEKVRRRIKI